MHKRYIYRTYILSFTIGLFGFVLPSLALAAAPDLIPGDVSATTLPATAVTGSDLLTAVITNQGNASTGVGFSNFFQVATAADGGGTVTDLPATPMPTLAAGASNTAVQKYSFPAAGTYSYRVCADETSSAGGGVITESNESNNCGGGNNGGGWQNVSITNSWGSPDTPVMTSASCSSGTATLSWGAIPGTPSYLAVLKVPSGTSCPTGWGPWIQANTCVSPPTAASTGKFTIGQQVATIGAANVRQTPGGTNIGSQPAAAVATVVSGPTSAAISGSGDPTLYSWWDLNFNSGVDGWVADDNLVAYTSTTTPLVLPTTMTITGLPSQTGYQAFAYAYQDNEGLSGESNHIAFSCSASAATPPAPVLSSASCTSGAATLNWSSVSADSYEPILRLPSTDTSCPAGWSPVIDMGTGASFEYKVLYCTPNSAPVGTSVSIAGLTASEGYGAFVYAKKAGVWSSDSNHVGFTCSPSPAAPVPPGLKGQAACWAPGDMGVPVQWDLCSQSKGNSVQIAVDTADAPETQWGYVNTSDCAGTNPWPGFVLPDDGGGYYVIARSPFNGTQYQRVFIPHPPGECSGSSDLTVDAPIAVSPAPSVGTPTTFTATVRNIGTTATEGNGFYTLFQYATGLDSNGNGIGVTDLAISKVPTLAAKPKNSFWSSLLAAVYLNGAIASSATAQIQDSYTFTSPGTYYVRACADKSSASDTGIIDESNENNNCSSPWTSVVVSSQCPIAGQLCNSGMNSCHMYNSGTYNNDASCTCSASTPDNSLCSGVTPTSLLQAPQRIRKGQAATLLVNAQNVTSCTLTGPLVQSGSNVNSITMNADAGNSIVATTTSQLLQSQATFTLTCTTTAGPTLSVQSMVSLLPQSIEK